MILELTDREVKALYNLIALGEIDVDRELVELEKTLEFFILQKSKKQKFATLGHDALCDGFTELARTVSEDGN